MAKILTYKARIEQVAPRLWKTLDNQLVELDDGRILLAPRNLLTDNNSNPFGDNDLSDVRASHFHDIGCRYHQLIYLTITYDDLITKGFVRPHFSKEDGAITVCEDISVKYLEIKDVGFNEVNNIFKQILLACGTSKKMANLMRFAVGCNIPWFFTKPQKLYLRNLYKACI